MTKDGNDGERILVTGAAGFLGRATVQRLRGDGRQVIAVDRLARGELPELITCDLSDGAAVSELFSSQRPTAVIHYAAFGSADAGLLASAERETERAVDVNLNGLRNVLHGSVATGVTRLVWSSSTTVYGPPRLYREGELLDEDALLAPFSLYGATKMIGESITRSFFSASRLQAVALRLPIVYGPGRWYGGAQKGLMTYIDDVLSGTSGTYAFSDQPTDLMFIDDAVAAMVAVLDAETVQRPVYNIVGHVDSVYGMAREVVRQTASSAEVERDPAGEPSILVDGRRFWDDFAVTAKVDRRQGIERYLRHLKEQRSDVKA